MRLSAYQRAFLQAVVLVSFSILAGLCGYVLVEELLIPDDPRLSWLAGVWLAAAAFGLALGCSGRH